MNRIVSSLKENLSSVAKILLIILLCGVSGILIAFPLWKLASIYPAVYTAIALTLISAALIFYIVRYFAKISVKKRIRTALKTLSVLLCSAGSVFLILNQHRILGIIALLLIPVFFFIIKISLYEKETE